jgi:hypothetical protein
MLLTDGSGIVAYLRKCCLAMTVFLSLILAIRPYVTVYNNAINSVVPPLLVYVIAQYTANAVYHRYTGLCPFPSSNLPLISQHDQRQRNC